MSFFGVAGFRGFIFSLTAACLIGRQLALTPLFAQEAELEPKGRLAGTDSSRNRHLRYSPLSLEGGSSLTLISPEKWASIADKLSQALQSTHNQLTVLIGPIAPLTTSIRLMEEDLFYASTGAPSWTNALYFHGQIIIPLSDSGATEMENIYRSVRHEYTHAVVNTVSAGRCPGWLDEGLAQWAEGPENPSLRPALAAYIEHNNPVSFTLLQGGFTKLDRDMVAAAYAQSLIATKAVIDLYGFQDIKRYFDLLRLGQSKRVAFSKAFRLTEEVFEKRLFSNLNLIPAASAKPPGKAYYGGAKMASARD